MTTLTTIGTFQVDPKQRELFVSGTLWQEWHDTYPNIFDDDDLRLANAQASLGYHFYEWLAAILLYHATGYLSLVEKYQYENHTRKQYILKQLNSLTLSKAIAYRGDYDNVQCPDLLVYAPDFSDWFFCEVKGAKDKVREVQERHFQTLADLTGKPIRLIRFYFVGEKNKHITHTHGASRDERLLD